MRGPKELTHRDQLHGDVIYDPLAVALLNTPQMQRLGRVYQLGFGHLVYRGGNHTRLSHVMGAYATAGQLVNALHRNYLRLSEPPKGAVSPSMFLPSTPDSKRGDESQQSTFFQSGNGAEADKWEVLLHLVSWAALLHDIAHIPLGHTLEDEFADFYQKHDSLHSSRIRQLWIATDTGDDSPIKKVFQKTHLFPKSFRQLGLISWEDVWGAVFLICMFKDERPTEREPMRTFSDALRESQGVTSETLEALHSRLNGFLFHPYMGDLVANTISADYLDYLRRDPHNLGLDVLRDDRVVSRFWIGRDDRKQLRMALSLEDVRGKRRLDTATGVVELVRQRFRFAEIVYYHKTKVAASAMLAKVLQLVGAPPDDLREMKRFAIGDASTYVEGLMKLPTGKRKEELRKIRESTLPVSLLDPEVGDESLLLLLLFRAFEQFSSAIQSGQAATNAAEAAHEAIGLIQSLARRELYRVAFTMEEVHFRILKRLPEASDTNVEMELHRYIEQLRQDGDLRSEIEAEMAEAAGWPKSSIILYVPERKVQAKGIETGALAGGSVVTLGEHSAVKDQVRYLSGSYRSLWRLVVLIHPDVAEDAVGCSEALDTFVSSSLGGSVGDGTSIETLREASWVSYVRPNDRGGSAPRLKSLVETASIAAANMQDPGPADIQTYWDSLAEVDAWVSGRLAEDELANLAAVHALLCAKVGRTKAESLLRGRFPNKDAFVELWSNERRLVSIDESREGRGEEQLEIEGSAIACQKIVDLVLAQEGS